MRRIIFIGIWLIVPTLAFAQEVLIVGNVVDEDNVPSPGAFVILKNNHTNNVIKYIATGQSYTFQ
jgi:hypothetical protein